MEEEDCGGRFIHCVECWVGRVGGGGGGGGILFNLLGLRSPACRGWVIGQEDVDDDDTRKAYDMDACVCGCVACMCVCVQFWSD